MEIYCIKRQTCNSTRAEEKFVKLSSYGWKITADSSSNLQRSNWKSSPLTRVHFPRSPISLSLFCMVDITPFYCMPLHLPSSYCAKYLYVFSFAVALWKIKMQIFCINLYVKLHRKILEHIWLFSPQNWLALEITDAKYPQLTPVCTYELLLQFDTALFFHPSQERSAQKDNNENALLHRRDHMSTTWKNMEIMHLSSGPPIIIQ